MLSSKFTYFIYQRKKNGRKKTPEGAEFWGGAANYFFLATTRTISKHCLA
jgi:hypothetical protein